MVGRKPIEPVRKWNCCVSFPFEAHPFTQLQITRKLQLFKVNGKYSNNPWYLDFNVGIIIIEHSIIHDKSSCLISGFSIFFDIFQTNQDANEKRLKCCGASFCAKTHLKLLLPQLPNYSTASPGSTLLFLGSTKTLIFRSKIFWSIILPHLRIIDIFRYFSDKSKC